MTSRMSTGRVVAHHAAMNDTKPGCIVCESNSDQVPLISMEYRGSTFRICPQHLPIIIHNPAELTGLLEGAENLKPSAHHD